mgnify:CR=1 FL=1
MKIIYWVGSTKDDLLGFPQKVREEMGYALYVAQKGSKHPSAKPLKGFRGAGVLEVVENYNMLHTSGNNEWLAYYFIENAMFRVETMWDILAHIYNLL